MIVEMRTYQLKPRSLAEVEKRWAEALPGRMKLSPLGGFFGEPIDYRGAIECWCFNVQGGDSVEQPTTVPDDGHT